MTEENRKLLLIDLSARLPYGVKIEITWWVMSEGTCINTTLEPDHIEQLLNTEDGVIDIEPYLRPMSSMTEDEEKEYYQKFGKGNETYAPHDLIDWLNAHHFDYRGLIEKGLALEAPKDMYK